MSVYKERRATHAVSVRNADNVVVIGGGYPVVVQSMTNTATEDIDATVCQTVRLAATGSELVRLTVNTPAAAKSGSMPAAALCRLWGTFTITVTSF